MAKKKTGRPTDYSEQLGEDICALIVDGLTLRQITDREDMPGKSTVFRWIARHEAFRDLYARAKELQAELMAEELLEIADDGSNDWMERELEGGGIITVLDHEHVHRSKLRVDTRKWIMAKLLPRKYGERVGLEHSGAVDLGVDKLLEAIDGRTRGLPGRG